MKSFLLILALGLGLIMGINADAQELRDRWGKGSFISPALQTLNGVQPLAHWIWDSGLENPRNYYLLVRKQFSLGQQPSEAKAFISAFAYADVYINGKLFERCPINCDPEYQCYDEFDIAKYLKTGQNTICAVVQNFGVGLHSQMNARGGFFLQASLNFADGSKTSLLTDRSWKVAHASAWNTKSPYRDDNAHLIGFIEEFDARLWPDGWMSPEFDDRTWDSAHEIGIPPMAPFNSCVVINRPQLERKVVKPVKQWKVGKLMVYDFGVEIVGYPQFTLDSKEAGLQIEVGTGEQIDDKRIPKLRVSSDHSEKYTTKQGIQSWRPFTWSGFRYFSVETKPGIQVKDVSAEFACYDYQTQGTFECSDPQLNQFWEIGKHTMRINSIDVYEDPWREHTQYIAGDCRFMQIYGNYAFGKSSRFLSAYNLICGAESQRWREDGAIRARYPTDYFLQPGSSAYLADYQLEWVLMMHEYFKYYGPDELIENLYPNLKKAIDYFKPFVDPKTGLLSKIPGWIVLDWPDTFKLERKDVITGLNCQYYGALNAAASIADDFAHDPVQAKNWAEQASRLRTNINKQLWSEKAHAYLDSLGGTKTNQQTQVYALVYGLADEGRKAGMLKLIMSRKKSSEESFAYWLLHTMFGEGKEEWALAYMKKYWGEQTKLPYFNGA